ncbi:MAG: PfkB family carbohydrate kinase [Candidatus Moranbacteria bacterium]|nr:PfkB family carbohydrate kinase [Candidatus Moranbacteria bacterium]
MITAQRSKGILSNAKNKPVLALGDVMLDAYLTGPVERLSQEAPVPIIAVQDEQFFPGGAGNAANCMATIGIATHLVGVVGGKGRINYAEILEEEYKKCGIITHFSTDPNRKTTLKLRLAAVKTTKQHVARVDMEDTQPLDAEKEKEVCEYMQGLVREINPAVISLHDYKKGFLTENIFKVACEISEKNQIPIFADLKQDTFVKYRTFIKNASLFFLKPNRNESVETAKQLNGFDKDGSSDEELSEVAHIIQNETPINIIITRGGKGAALYEIGKDPYFVRPEEVEEQFDVAGAGDTVEAFLVAGYLGGATIPEALEIAIAASQVAIRKFGTSVVTEEELLAWLEN